VRGAEGGEPRVRASSGKTMLSRTPALPGVSILIPTFRQGHVVHKAIESALGQSLCELEVIVVDDHSPDDTERVCATWRHDPRFHYVRNRRNLGRVANYRKALYELARGEWVVMLDGDDYLTDPHFVSRGWQLTRRYAGERVAFVQAGHVCRRSNGASRDVVVLPGIDGPHRLLSGAEYLELVYATGFFSHLGIFYNRRIAIENDCYRANISSSDMESFLRIALGHHVVLLNTTVGAWVQHGGNTSLQLPASEIAENVRIFRSIAELAISRGLLGRSDIEVALSLHEARTLAYLCAQVVARDGLCLPTLFYVVQTTLSLHPRATFYGRFLRLLLSRALRHFGRAVLG
jgi:glycosyltransferase involved in cell wall biosynthesis